MDDCEVMGALEGDCDRLEAENASLRAERDALRAAFKAMEWTGEAVGDERCLSCKRRRFHAHDSETHYEGCLIAAALALGSSVDEGRQ